MLKKITLVIDVDDVAQRDRVQQIADEVSNMRVLKGNQIENMYPVFRKYENDLRQIFHNVSHNGFGPQTMLSIGKLASNIMRK